MFVVTESNIKSSGKGAHDVDDMAIGDDSIFLLAQDRRYRPVGIIHIHDLLQL